MKISRTVNPARETKLFCHVADLLHELLQRAFGQIAGLLRAVAIDLLHVLLVLHDAGKLSLNRREGFDGDVCDGSLQIAIALALERGGNLLDILARERGSSSPNLGGRLIGLKKHRVIRERI